MNKITYMIIMVLLTMGLIKFTTANTTIDVTIISDDNIDANTVYIAEDTINANIECYAGTCNYNVQTGDIIPNNSTEYIYNDNSYYYEDSSIHKSGWTFKRLVNFITYNTQKYMTDKNMNRDFIQFLDILSVYFVPQPVYNLHLTKLNAAEHNNDLNNAKLRYIENILNITYDDELLEIYTAIEMSKRTLQPITTSTGYICNYLHFEDNCVKI